MCMICGDQWYCPGCDDPWEVEWDMWVDENPIDSEGVTFEEWKSGIEMENAAAAYESQKEAM